VSTLHFDHASTDGHTTSFVCGERAVFALTDGTGSWGRGDVAAARALEIVVEEMQGGELDFVRLEDALRSAGSRTRAELATEPEDDTAFCAIAACVSEHELAIAWCGGASALLLRDGQILRRTRPHVQGELHVEAGMSRKLVFARPQAWATYRHLGAPYGHDIDRTPTSWRLEQGDFVALVSERLFGHLVEVGLGRALSSPEPAKTLVQSALDSGVKGELSAVVLWRAFQGVPRGDSELVVESGAMELPLSEATLPTPSARRVPDMAPGLPGLEVFREIKELPVEQQREAFNKLVEKMKTDTLARASDPDPEIRSRALASIAPLHRLEVPGFARDVLFDEQQLDELIDRGLRDDSEEVRSTAAKLAFACNRGRAVESELLRALECEPARWPALLALGGAEGPESLAALIRYAKDDDGAHAGAAVRALAQRDDGFEVWWNALQDPRWDVRRSARFALAHVVGELPEDKVAWLMAPERERDLVDAAKMCVWRHQANDPLRMQQGYEQLAAALRAEHGVDVPWQSVAIGKDVTTYGGALGRPLERIILDGVPLREHPKYAEWAAEIRRPHTTDGQHHFTLLDWLRQSPVATRVRSTCSSVNAVALVHGPNHNNGGIDS
jgi:serine/threonine protein phosphatase PrpC